MTLEIYYKVNHRLASSHYSLTEIEAMLPYERDIYMSLVYIDHEKANDKQQ